MEQRGDQGGQAHGGDGASRRARAARIIESRRAWRQRTLWALGLAGAGASLALAGLMAWG